MAKEHQCVLLAIHYINSLLCFISGWGYDYFAHWGLKMATSTEYDQTTQRCLGFMDRTLEYRI
ncbi:hypothetical protein I7I50_05163 [Histoplasma capsulatum G186AR]|uniref:Uncharacterized protein n=1 Tax=Ajellomyces capsulatus TaxID=5037 RepID=A0A8H8D7Y3_AJECA|nr:hypothetical protein I7I52_03421 [Histoplasma capsulatum]QSS75880.1 hypothetical protein I7I50_05163 [Histoplasma capsulatum G186AR]